MGPDINQLDLQNEVVETTGGDAANEGFFSPPILDDGEHIATMILGDRGTKLGRQKDKASGQKTGAAFLNVHVQLKVEGDGNGKPAGSAFDNLSSIIMQSGTSRLHAALAMAGNSAPARCTLGELKDHTELALAQTPQVGFVSQWEAQVQDGAEYRTVLKGQKKFPKIMNPDGTWSGKYNPEVEDPKTGETCRAQTRVVRYFRA